MLFRTIIFMAVLFIFVVVAQSELRIGGNHDFEYVIRDIDRDWSVRLDRFEQDSRDRDAEQDRELSRMDSKLDNLIQLHARLEAFKDMTLCIVRSALGFMIGVIGSFVLFKV